MFIIGGDTSMQGKSGGRIQITGGVQQFDKVSSNAGSEASGGTVQVNGGEAKGKESSNAGGSVAITGGTAAAGTGGSIFLTSGFGTTRSSGLIALSTSNGGTVGGISGGISLQTGRPLSLAPVWINAYSTFDVQARPVSEIQANYTCQRGMPVVEEVVASS